MKDETNISIERLKYFEPIANLAPARLEELVALSYIERLGIGVSLFREGDVDHQTVYLLQGDVQFGSSDGKIEKIITSHSPEAKYALDDSQPRQSSCVALTNVEIVRIDNSVLDYMMMWDELAVAEIALEPKSANAEQTATQDETETMESQISDSKEDKEWMRKVQNSLAFKNLPPANVKTLLERMEPLSVQAGETILKQGDPGDYYYLLTEGEAQVARTVELAVLEAGAGFGEEALVSGRKRNASVTMKSDGTVMRLSKKDFEDLLIEPILTRVSPDEARQQISQGAKWLDVRHAKEYQRSHLPSALNIPLHELRMRINELDKECLYICCCRTGQRSSSAAFLMMQNGYKASLLSGGIQVMTQDLNS